jgi:gag-polypeptide of LTR copia-type
MTENSYKNLTNSSLTNILLNGKNYLPWARAITVALGGKSMLGHITGKTVKPEEKATTFDAWQANQRSSGHELVVQFYAT